MTRPIAELGYVGFEVSDLARWKVFACDVLGLGWHEDDDGAVRLRMDEHAHRVILTEGPSDDLSFVGWQAPDRAALEAYVATLAGRKIEVTSGTSAELALRGIQAMLWFTDPAGVRHEAFCGPGMGLERFVSPRVAGRFVTGAGGLGHVVIGADAYKDALAFATDVLGASLTDFISQPMRPDFSLEVAFLHINERHHSLAYAARAGLRKIHHLMIEVDRVDEVGRARDRALANGFRIAQDLGQHPNDKMISFYVETPSGFLVEFGWGGVTVHDEGWNVVTYPRFSEWGHRPLEHAGAERGAGAIP